MNKFESLLTRLETVVKDEEAKKVAPHAVVADPLVADKTALLAEITQKGSGIAKDLRPVDESKDKEVSKKPKKAKKTEVAKKEARKTASGPNTFYENYANANLIFKAEDLAISDGYYLREAKDSNFDFQGKVRNIFLERCTSVKIICTVRRRGMGSR